MKFWDSALLELRELSFPVFTVPTLTEKSRPSQGAVQT